jgi:heme/copper-type cytochrome/quinol oxidase subunit 2
MKNWFGVLTSVLLIYPQLYPGYLMPEGKHNLGTLKIGVSTGWILLSICITVLVLVYILFWRGALSHKRTDHQYKNVQQK